MPLGLREHEASRISRELSHESGKVVCHPYALDDVSSTYLQHSSRRRWMISMKMRPLHTRERLHTYFSGGWLGLWTGLDGIESLANTGIRFTDRPVRNESLYRLSHPGHEYETEQI